MTAFQDGSPNIIKNIAPKGDGTNLICQKISVLTEPQNLKALMNRMVQEGLLSSNDVKKLEDNGILQSNQKGRQTESSKQQQDDLEKM